jgi:SH3 domain protein
MKKHMKPLAIFIGLATTLNVFADAYITDQVDIPMRAEKTFGDNIVRSLLSGDKLAILQATEDGWTQVEFQGLTGWIVSRYITEKPSARAELKHKTRLNKVLILKNKVLILKNKKLRSDLKAIKNKCNKL